MRIPLVIAAIVGGYFLLKTLLPDIELQELLDDVSETLGDWTYLLVGVLAFLETGAFVGLVAPGETFVILAGAVAGQGTTNVVPDDRDRLGVGVGRRHGELLHRQRLGRSFLMRHGRRVRITPERIGQVEEYFKRHGGKTILIGRFIGLVRALAPFIAGSSGMPYRQFVPYSIIGTGLWAAAFTLIGYFAAQSIDAAAEYAGRGTFLLRRPSSSRSSRSSSVDPLPAGAREPRGASSRTWRRNRVLRPLVDARGGGSSRRRASCGSA